MSAAFLREALLAAAQLGDVIFFAEHGANAWLAPPGDTAAFTQALGRLLSTPALRARLGEGARVTAQGRGWDAIYDGLFEEYARVAACRREDRAA